MSDNHSTAPVPSGKSAKPNMSERNRNVLMLVEIEMSAGHSFRLLRNPRRQG
jgi:hypothetical protein